MGQCNSAGNSQAFTAQELAFLPLNETKQMNKGCGPSIVGKQAGSGYDRLVQRGFGFPNSEEFEWGGLGESCSMCSDAIGGYGCDNCIGSQTIQGNRGSVKRVAYKANPEQCCTTQQTVINDLTCDPSFLTYQNSNCDSYMKSFCDGTTPNRATQCRPWLEAVSKRYSNGTEGFSTGNDLWMLIISLIIIVIIVWVFGNFKY